jgi:diadenosine tetraphosphate (Ap4A) HIT family hydrolase
MMDSPPFPSLTIPCPFCNPDETKVILQTNVVIAVRDAYPITDGHTLVIPRQHVTSIFDLKDAEQSALWKAVAHVRDILLREHAPDGFNIGVNDGFAAGQTIEHAHVHVIPRRRDDVPDPRGGIRNIVPCRARYWEK